MPAFSRLVGFAQRLVAAGGQPASDSGSAASEFLGEPGNAGAASASGSSPEHVTPAAGDPVQEYWTSHNVTNHRRFSSQDESLEYLHWRNSQYLGYIELMPFAGRDGEVVVDFGCGPGHDLVGFAEFGKAARIVGIDVSSSSLAEAMERLALHSAPVELHLASPVDPQLPLEDNSVDYIHSSGVLHHIPDPSAVLQEFRRVLRPGGKGRIMVYFQDSLWYHLYVPYHLRLLRTDYVGMSQEDAFTRSTDGPNCPVSRCFTVEEVNALFCEQGLSCRFVGSAISLFEMSLLPTRFDAMMHEGLHLRHRTFLSELTFNERGIPLYRGTVAGIDGMFEFTKS